MNSFQECTTYINNLRLLLQNQYENKVDFPLKITTDIDTYNYNKNDLRSVLVIRFYANSKEILQLHTTRYKNIEKNFDKITMAFDQRFKAIFSTPPLVFNLDK